jgi:hypothetical protein
MNYNYIYVALPQLTLWYLGYSTGYDVLIVL